MVIVCMIVLQLDAADSTIIVESRSWRDRNLKFGPNCDLEVDNFFLQIHNHNLQAKF